MRELPRYDDLPATAEGARSGWGVFGEDDNLGLINLLTPERVVSAAALIQRGRMFRLDAPIDVIDVPFAAHRTMPRHKLIHAPDSMIFDDVIDNFFLQGSSQWDSLGHYGYLPDKFYNGATEDDVATGRRNTIDHWARHGIAGRAVLLDIPRSWGDDDRTYSPNAPIPLGVKDLERAREHAEIEFHAGDTVMIRTGFLAWYEQLDGPQRLAVRRGYAHPGLEQSEEVCRYLWNNQIVGVASDTVATEMMPPPVADLGAPFTFLHRVLIGLLGIALGELWDLEALADDCARDKVYEMFLVSSPLFVRGAIGSPPNVTVFK